MISHVATQWIFIHASIMCEWACLVYVCAGVCCNTLHAPSPYVVGAPSSYGDKSPSMLNGSPINAKENIAIPMTTHGAD